MHRATYLLIAMMVVPITARAQTVGDCELGRAEVDLNVNNVRARLYNLGNLFWKGAGNFYTIPKSGTAESFFTSGVWLGGLDEEGVLRFAGTNYGSFEYWPGPLDEGGNPPEDCAVHDHIYSIYRSDLEAFDRGEAPTEDILNWPFELGAPVLDGDGDPDNYNIAAGDRPHITGDQMAWWVMNDAGNEKPFSDAPPTGIEVQVSAFAFADSSVLNNTTFYRYKLINKRDEPLSNIYFGLWNDVDVGNASDDFVASDSILGLGITYNGREADLGIDGYGETPPALGIDFVQGPVPAENGQISQFVNYDGRLTMTTSFWNWDTDPRDGSDKYELMQAIWVRGSPLTYAGSGMGRSSPTSFMYTGNSAKREFWSEENTDGVGSRNTPSDRNILTATGPFDMQPGDVQEIVVAIIWSRSTSRLASYAKLLEDDIYVQGRFDVDFAEPDVIDAPVLSASSSDQRIVLSWDNPPSSNNHLESFDARSAYVYNKLGPVHDLTYTFEGYEVIEYTSPLDSTGKVVAVHDLKNQVTGVTEEQYDRENDLYVNRILATGSDAGVQHHHIVEDVINYQDYHFGIRAYAYSANSRPQVQKSTVARISVTPGPISSTGGGSVATADVGERIEAMRVQGTGESSGIFATIVDPGRVPGIPYRIEVLELPDTTAVSYSILDAVTGEHIVDGSETFEQYGVTVPFTEDVVYDDGVTLSVTTPDPAFSAFLAVANGSGPIDPPTGAAADFQGYPVPIRPNSQQQNGDGIWLYATGDVGPTANYRLAFIRNSIRNGFEIVGSYDYEVRFTHECYSVWRDAMNAGTPFSTPANGCFGYDGFENFGDERPILVPFELWNIGVSTFGDASDDFRMIPTVNDVELDGYDMQFNDSALSSADNDPELDWFSWFNPCNISCSEDDYSPGEDGYVRWQQSILGGAEASLHGREVMSDATFVNWNGGSVRAASDKSDYLDNIVDQDMPEAGSVFRLVTKKPLVAGDVFIVDTQPFAALTNQDAVLDDAMDGIGIVPNPYLGASAYEVGESDRKVRFTGMPDRATVHIFTLAGTLVRRLEKNDASPFLDWDLRNDEGHAIGSGLFLVHVDVPGVGERVLKFGHVGRK